MLSMRVSGILNGDMAKEGAKKHHPHFHSLVEKQYVIQGKIAAWHKTDCCKGTWRPVDRYNWAASYGSKGRPENAEHIWAACVLFSMQVESIVPFMDTHRALDRF